MRVKLTADLDLIDPNKIDKFIKEEVGNIFKNAVVAFLTAMFQRIPVRTGFLQGSYRDIANAFGVPVLEGGSKLRYTLSGFADTKQHAMLFVSGKKLLKAWQKDEGPNRISEQSQDNIKSFKRFLKGNRRTIETSLFVKGANGSVAAEDGRHRMLVMMGLKFARVPITVKKSEFEYFRSNFAGSSRLEIYTHSDGQEVAKTPSSGVMFVTPVGEVLTFEADEIVFNINNKILYLNPNDTKYGWLSQQYGLDAFFQQLRSEVGRLGLRAEKLFTKVNIS